MPDIHRTARFAIHHPTRHAIAVLETAFKQYTAIYTECLHACKEHYDLDTIRGLATYMIEEKTGKPRMSAKKLANEWHRVNPSVTKTYAGMVMPLESRLRQSLREHIAQTLLSYVQLADRQLADPSVGGAPSFPARLHRHQVEQAHKTALTELSVLADNVRRENALRDTLTQTAQSPTIAIPFVGISSDYSCGLYYNRATNQFYARLDIVGNTSHLGKPLAMRGQYIDIKTGTTWSVEPSEGVETFGRGRKSIFVLLEMGRWHETGFHQLPTAFLPQRHLDPSDPTPATPVSAKLVRKIIKGDIQYQLHVSFALPTPEPDGLTERPILAINRGIHHLYTAVLTDTHATEVREMFMASGDTLGTIQRTMEQQRQQRQQRGASIKSNGKQSRIAEQHLALCAKQIVAYAATHHAQVVMEEMKEFATGQALRAVSTKPHKTALRAMLNRRQFERLHQIVDWRLEELGLPPVRLVGASYISQTCPVCGYCDKGNRAAEDWRQFVCQRCSMTGDVDVIAAMNVARKFRWLRLRGEEKKKDLPERTAWNDYAHTHPILTSVSGTV